MQNETTNMVLLYLLFFAIIFFAAEKVFHTNRAVAFIVALAVSFFATAGIINYANFAITGVYWWAVFLAALVGLLMFIRIIMDIGIKFFLVCLIAGIAWFVLKNFAYGSLPDISLRYGDRLAVIAIIIGLIGLLVNWWQQSTGVSVGGGGSGLGRKVLGGAGRGVWRGTKFVGRKISEPVRMSMESQAYRDKRRKEKYYLSLIKKARRRMQLARSPVLQKRYGDLIKQLEKRMKKELNR